MLSILRKFSIFILLLLLGFLVGCPQKAPRKPEITKPAEEKFPDSIAADFPTDLTFTKDKLFFTEKDGNLKVLDKGSSKPKIIRRIKVLQPFGYNETGLLGIALSPNFEQDQLIYLYHTYEQDSQLFNKVIRINAEKPKKAPVTVIEGIKGAKIHNGGKLAFGPDGMLYIATGDAAQQDLAQDTASLNGKVLRAKPDGSIPAGNPFNNAVWSFGHRNIFGMTFDNKGNLFVTENGPDVNDEVNKIIKGGNYGWPIETGPGSGHFISPLITYKAQIAPTGIIFYTGKRYQKDLANKLVFGDWLNGDVHRLQLQDSTAQDKIIATSKGQINALAQTKDGFIYLSTGKEIKKLMVD